MGLNLVHGEDNVCSGPIYDRMAIEDDRIRLYFNYIGSGLIKKGDKLEGFEICGNDDIFHPAEAMIDGDRVIVSSKE